MASSPVRLGRRASSAAGWARRVASRARRVASWVRRWYGANPLHLLALLAAFALAGYAVHAVVAAGEWTGFAVWFAVAIIAHDLLLFPLYSLADLSLRHLLPGGSHGRLLAAQPATHGRPPAAQPATHAPFEAFQPPPRAAPAARVTSVAGAAGAAGAAGTAPAWPPLLNYVRIPVIFSLLLLMTFFPMILGLSEPELHRASGLGTGPYVWRWLGVTGVMFAISAVCYAAKTRRLTRRLARRTGRRTR